MAVKKAGVLVKEARTAAGLTQEKLAKQAGEGLTAADIGKCERGTADLTTAQLKRIAIVCGVTQTSLVNAPKNLKTGSKPSAAKKPAQAKPAAAAKPAAEKKPAAAAKKPAAAAKKPAAAVKKPAVPASANLSMKVTAAEKKLVEAYRGASGDMKKAALKVLKGEYGDQITALLNAAGGGSSSSGSAGSIVSDAIGSLLGNLLGGK